jgi:hypothetical protein
VDFIGLAMRAFWLDPYLWIHLAGLAALPIFLELCLVGLAIGDPILPAWLELLLVAGVGIAPVLWMQWQRPFYIFSIVLVALKPDQLTEDQRRLLTQFKSQRQRWLAVGAAIALFFGLRWMFVVAAIASETVPAWPGGRATGLLLAAAAFLASNLFLQVPVSVAGVMLTGDSDFIQLTPYPLEQIRPSFTLLGLQIRQILPPLVVEPPPPVLVTDPAAKSVSDLASDTLDPWESPAASAADPEPALPPEPIALASETLENSEAPENSVPAPVPESVPEPETEAMVADLEAELEQLETETSATEAQVSEASVEIAESNPESTSESGSNDSSESS